MQPLLPSARSCSLLHLRRRPSRAAFASVLTAAALFLTLPVSGAQAEKSAAAQPAKPAEYVGSQTCQACHDDLFTVFQKNPHVAVETNKKRGWDGKACESCHGPGGKHAESTDKKDIRNPGKLATAEADRMCLACHLNQPTQVGRGCVS